MKVRLSNKFYTKEAVEDAMRSFSELCDAKIVDDSYEVELIPRGDMECDIAGEFCNFVLGVVKDRQLF
jgi:hypothetical protein